LILTILFFIIVTGALLSVVYQDDMPAKIHTQNLSDEYLR